MNKYQITHYWSDENTFPDIIETYTLRAKNEDNIIKKIKSYGTDKEVSKQIYDLGCYPTVLGIDMVYDEYGTEYTQDEYIKKFGDINENQYHRFYGWDIIQIE